MTSPAELVPPEVVSAVADVLHGRTDERGTAPDLACICESSSEHDVIYAADLEAAGRVLAVARPLIAAAERARFNQAMAETMCAAAARAERQRIRELAVSVGARYEARNETEAEDSGTLLPFFADLIGDDPA
jgi:hypothetical protein